MHFVNEVLKAAVALVILLLNNHYLHFHFNSCNISYMPLIKLDILNLLFLRVKITKTVKRFNLWNWFPRQYKILAKMGWIQELFCWRTRDLIMQTESKECGFYSPLQSFRSFVLYSRVHFYWLDMGKDRIVALLKVDGRNVAPHILPEIIFHLFLLIESVFQASLLRFPAVISSVMLMTDFNFSKFYTSIVLYSSHSQN